MVSDKQKNTLYNRIDVSSRVYVYSGKVKKISLTAGPIVQQFSGKFIICHCKELAILKLGQFNYSRKRAKLNQFSGY